MKLYNLAVTGTEHTIILPDTINIVNEQTRAQSWNLQCGCHVGTICISRRRVMLHYESVKRKAALIMIK